MMTKTNWACGLVSWTLLAACGGRPDSALFSSEPQAQAGSASAGKNGMASGGSSAGGSDDAPVAGGTKGLGGASGGKGAQGGKNSDGGTAGAAAGTAGETDAGGTAGSGGMAGTGGGATQPVCGNGKLEDGEECDDAGHEGKDGCNQDCDVVCGDFGDGSVTSEDLHCYQGSASGMALTFEAAQQACVARGGHLVTISSETENTIAEGFVVDGKWIGAFEEASLMAAGSGLYQWVTKEPLSFTNWSEGEPNRDDSSCNGITQNPRCYQHCVVMLGDGDWADRRCDIEDGYICEWEPAGSGQ